MTICDDMRGYVHAHDRNGWFDVATETTPMYQMVDKADVENEKLRELVRDMFEEIEANGFDPYVERQGKRGPYYEEDPSWRVGIRERVRELGIEVDG